jgi:hypothetical protein
MNQIDQRGEWLCAPLRPLQENLARKKASEWLSAFAPCQTAGRLSRETLAKRNWRRKKHTRMRISYCKHIVQASPLPSPGERELNNYNNQIKFGINHRNLCEKI